MEWHDDQNHHKIIVHFHHKMVDVAQIVRADEPPANTISIAFFNCGGFGHDISTHFTTWLHSIPPSTSILGLCELKSHTLPPELKPCVERILGQSGDDFEVRHSLLSSEQSEQIHALQVASNKKKLESSSHAKGGMAIFIRKDPILQVRAWRFHPSTRAITLDTASGARIAFLYGPAHGNSYGPAGRNTYLMSKEQFVDDIMKPLLSENTIIIGDLNLQLNARDDRGVASSVAAERKISKLLMLQKMTDVLEAILPPLETPAPTYDFHSKPSRPDRIIVPQSAIANKAIASVTTLPWGTWQGHLHGTLCIEIALDRLLIADAPPHLVASRAKKPTPGEYYNNVAKDCAALEQLANELESLDRQDPEYTDKINVTLRTRVKEAADAAYSRHMESKRNKMTHNPEWDIPEIRIALKQKHTILGVTQSVRRALDQWAKADYAVGSSTIATRHRKKWRAAVRKCSLLLFDVLKEDAIAFPPEIQDPPSGPTVDTLKGWLLQADHVLKTIETAVKTKTDALKEQVFAAAVHDAAKSITTNLKLTITRLRRAAERQQDQKEVPKFRVVSQEQYNSAEEEERMRADASAEYWEKIASETKHAPDHSIPEPPWVHVIRENTRQKPPKGVNLLLEPITSEEARSATKTAAKSMPTFNATTNKFFHLIFASSEDSKNPDNQPCSPSTRAYCYDNHWHVQCHLQWQPPTTDRMAKCRNCVPAQIG